MLFSIVQLKRKGLVLIQVAHFVQPFGHCRSLANTASWYLGAGRVNSSGMGMCDPKSYRSILEPTRPTITRIYMNSRFLNYFLQQVERCTTAACLSPLHDMQAL